MPVTLNALALSASTFVPGATAGTVIGAILNRTLGSTVTVDDTRLSVSSDSLVVGLTSTPTATTINANLIETLGGATNSPRTTPISVTVASALPNLNALTLSNSNFDVGASAGTVIGAIGGRTEGSTITVSDTRVAVSGGNLIVGPTAASAGSFSVTLTETLAGYANSPRTTDFTINVGTVGGTLSALTLSSSTVLSGATAGTVISTINGRTPGSTLSLIDTAGNRFAISGANLVAGPVATDFATSASHSITIRETLASASNSPRDTTLTITVNTPKIVIVDFSQSNGSGRLTSNQTFTSTGAGAQLFGNDYVLKALADPTDSATGQIDTVSSDASAAGSIWPLVFTRLLEANSATPMVFVPASRGGTSITARLPGTNREDRTTLYGSMVYRARQAGAGQPGVTTVVVMIQGETDAAAGMSQSTYAGHLSTIATAIEADLGAEFVVCKFPFQATTAGTAGQTAIYAAIDAAWTAGTVAQGADFSLIRSDTADDIHVNQSVKAGVMADLLVPRIQAALGQTPGLVDPTPNYITSGSDFTAWTAPNVAVSANAVANPFASANDADRVTTNAGSTVKGLTSPGFTPASLSRMTFAVYAKQGTARYLQIFGNTANFGGTGYVNYDLQTGLVTASAEFESAIINIGAGWYLLLASAVPVATTAGAQFTISCVSSGTAARAATGPDSLTFDLYGAQAYHRLGIGDMVFATADTTAPTITSSASQSVVEGTPFSMTLTANEAVTWSLVGGADQAQFSLSGATLSMTAKTFASPVDADANNTYIVQVRATDGAGNVANQTITVTVTASATNFVTNGTFTSNITGWSSFSASTFAWDATDGGVLRATRSGTTPMAIQQITGLTSGSTYRVRFDCRRVSGTCTMTVAIKPDNANGTSIATSAILSNDTWARDQEFTFVAPAGQTWVYLLTGTENGVADWDNIRITAV